MNRHGRLDARAHGRTGIEENLHKETVALLARRRRHALNGAEQILGFSRGHSPEDKPSNHEEAEDEHRSNALMVAPRMT